MKKTFLISVIGFMLFSCNKEKKNEEPKLEKISKYMVNMEILYTQDDSLSLVYKLDTYFQYENSIGKKIEGSKDLQNISFTIPEGIPIENIQITLSTNKEQGKIAIKNIFITNDGKIIKSSDNAHLIENFNFNDGVSSFDIKDNTYTLKFDGAYPPGMTGTDTLESDFLK